MKFKSTIASIVLSLALPLVSPAQSAAPALSPASDASRQGVPTPQLQTVDGRKSNTVRADLSAGWARYQQIKFEPAAYEPAGPDRALNARDSAKILSMFAASLEAAFKHFQSDERATGDSTGGATLLVKPIITNVKRTSTIINLISFAAVQMPASYGAASVRYDLVDQATGTLIGEIASCRKARPWNVYPWNLFQNFEALGQSSVILKSDARTLRRDLRRLSRLRFEQGGAAATGAE